MSMEERLNPQITRIPPSGIRKFFDVVNEMPDAISLGVGEPDFVTPWNIREAAMYSLRFTIYSLGCRWRISWLCMRHSMKIVVIEY